MYLVQLRIAPQNPKTPKLKLKIEFKRLNFEKLIQNFEMN